MYQYEDPSATAQGEFTDGNPALGVARTTLRSSWPNMIQRELLNVVQAAGIAPAPDQFDQLLKAIKLLGVPTGSLQFMMRLDEPFGWLRVDPDYLIGRTDGGPMPSTHFGDAYYDFYAVLWALPNAVAQMVNGSRGASAEEDWQTTKRIRMPTINRFIRVLNLAESNIGEYFQDQNKQHNHGGTTGNRIVGPLDTNIRLQGSGGGTQQRTEWGSSSSTETAKTSSQNHNHSISIDGGDEAQPRHVRYPLFVKL